MSITQRTTVSDHETDKSSGRSPSPTQVTGKRKRDTVSKRAAKRRKAKSKSDPRDDALDVEAGINNAIGHMDPSLLADHIAQRSQRLQPDLSMVELDELRIPSSAITDTTDWRETRTVENLPDFLERQAAQSQRPGKLPLGQASKRNGAPHTLVVAGAGLRAADLTRVLRKFQSKDAKIEKLFAKHIKLKEATETVKKTRIGIGVGTPQRIIDLLGSGALSSKALERIVVDASHIDAKKRGVLDMRETQVPLIKLLCRKELMDMYEGGERKLNLLFY